MVNIESKSETKVYLSVRYIFGDNIDVQSLFGAVFDIRKLTATWNKVRHC